MSALAELFPDGDHRFHLTLRRVEPREFFAPRDPTGKILAERRHWIAVESARHVALQTEGVPVFEEFAEQCAAWNLSSAGTLPALGAAIEPDILFLAPDATGIFRLRGGALVFPSGWALEEKIGQTIESIHGVVPGLNPALASPIQQFLARLKPGVAFLRDNWGLAASDALNRHPALGLPPPMPPVSLDRLWLRVERQALLCLPHTGGVVFAIRIELHRLDEVAGDLVAAAGFRRALQTMPDELAAYKRIDGIRSGLIAALQ